MISQTHILSPVGQRKHMKCLNWGILLFDEKYFEAGGNNMSQKIGIEQQKAGKASGCKNPPKKNSWRNIL